ncbi:tautomerase [Chitinophaga sp. Cy-1792]|uniref:tautomerase n=1 Tax=Chitinophaga sp. Cy-1792 TaxID=2608339 RepID=UPI001421E7D1|nr:tautomerase [Chitinophaga sp. Cy-1792]NIG55526.1 tautomerase [Chitinophaga sp. Cy-1792]
MPYLQLDVNGHYSLDVKRRWAKRMGDTYAEIMTTEVSRITVALRELGEGAVWRCGKAEPRQVALLMCDIRRGRTPDRRGRLAKALLEVCTEMLNLQADSLNIEFTQHSGDEMYHPLMGGFSDDWREDEMDTPDNIEKAG